MESHAQQFALDTRRVLGLQIGIGLLVVAGFFLLRGPWEALSAAYGGGTSIVSAVLLRQGVAWAGSEAPQGARRGQAILYVSAALRFVLVLAMLGGGLAALGLAPLPLVIGFIAVQLAFLGTLNLKKGT